MPVGRDAHVRRFEIAVDDAALVRRLEAARDLQRDLDRVIDRHGAAREPLREVLALDELHHQRALFHAVDVRDVLVIERGEGLRLAAEAGQPIGIGGEELRQDLDRDVTLEASCRARDRPRPFRRRRERR